MDETTKKLFYEVQHRVEHLKLTEYKYTILVNYIKEEAKKEIYFDRDKILKMIDILDQKTAEEEQEKNKNE